MTLPLIMMSFGTLSVVALTANLLSAPFIPFAMAVTFLTGIIGMIFPSFSYLAGLVTEIVLSYFVAIVRWLSSPTWAQIDLTISPQTMIAVYLIVIALIVYIAKKTKHNFRSQSIVD